MKEDIVLHLCCGVCSLSLWYELEKQFTVHGFWYNPNIYPEEEYIKRKIALQTVKDNEQLDISFLENYGGEEWRGLQNQLVNSENNRCWFCYHHRFTCTAKYTLNRGYRKFTTTLLTSPYQDLDQIKYLGDTIARQWGLEFYYADFRYRHYPGINSARQMGIYRQKYCGCYFSLLERRQSKS